MSYTTPEKKVQTKILKYLKDSEKAGEPLFFEHRVAAGGSYKKGVPDIYIVYKGIHIEVEVKCEDGHLSAMQEKFRDKCDRIGIIYLNPYSFDEFKRDFEFIKITI